MRSRFSAFAVGDPAYLLATWHAEHPAAAPSTSTPRSPLDPPRRAVPPTGGSMFDTEGTVEFRAHYVVAAPAGAQHENSRFVREGGRWFYLDGVTVR